MNIEYTSYKTMVIHNSTNTLIREFTQILVISPRTAVTISLCNLPKIFALAMSLCIFLNLIFAHLLCPAIDLFISLVADAESLKQS